MAIGGHGEPAAKRRGGSGRRGGVVGGRGGWRGQHGSGRGGGGKVRGRDEKEAVAAAHTRSRSVPAWIGAPIFFHGPGAGPIHRGVHTGRLREPAARCGRRRRHHPSRVPALPSATQPLVTWPRPWHVLAQHAPARCAPSHMFSCALPAHHPDVVIAGLRTPRSSDSMLPSRPNPLWTHGDTICAAVLP